MTLRLFAKRLPTHVTKTPNTLVRAFAGAAPEAASTAVSDPT